MVEFAIVAPLLFALIFGIVDFGRAFLLWNNMTNATRDAARQGAVNSTLDSIAIRTVLRSRLSAVSPWGNDSGKVKVTFPGGTGTRTIKVVLDSFPFKPATFLVLRRIPKLTSKAEFRWEPQ